MTSRKQEQWPKERYQLLISGELFSEQFDEKKIVSGNLKSSFDGFYAGFLLSIVSYCFILF